MQGISGVSDGYPGRIPGNRQGPFTKRRKEKAMKTLRIIAVLALSILVLGLTACPAKPPVTQQPPPTQQPPQTPPETTPPVDTPPATPALDFTPTEGIPEGWPVSVPVMEGLEVVNGGIGGETAEFDFGLILTGTVKIEDVLDYYANLATWAMDDPQTRSDYVTFTDESGNHLMASAKPGEGEKVNVVLLYSATGEKTGEETTTEEEQPAEETPAEEEKPGKDDETG
jgi:hypothetical protein